MMKSKFLQGEITRSGRKRNRTEIFTPYWLVRDMCSLLEKENPDVDVFAPERTFMEPSCGDGEFVLEIYRRKLERCRDRNDAAVALCSLVCIEMQEDNMRVCRERVRALFESYGYGDLDFDYVFQKNFIVGDALRLMAFVASDAFENARPECC